MRLGRRGEGEKEGRAKRKVMMMAVVKRENRHYRQRERERKREGEDEKSIINAFHFDSVGATIEDLSPTLMSLFPLSIFSLFLAGNNGIDQNPSQMSPSQPEVECLTRVACRRRKKSHHRDERQLRRHYRLCHRFEPFVKRTTNKERERKRDI